MKPNRTNGRLRFFIRVLQKATVIYVSQADTETVEALHMVPAASLDEAIAKAKLMVAKENPSITAIPDGVAVMVKGV